MPTRLRDKIPFIIDYETRYTPQLSLKKMSQRRYLAQTSITSAAVQIGRGTKPHVYWPSDVDELKDLVHKHHMSDDHVVLAYNSAFDTRVSRHMLGLPWPKNELCIMDLARAAFPNQPGGYSLENMSTCLPGIPPKLEIDLREGHHTEQELKAYVARDVEAAAAIYELCLKRLGDNELELAAMTARARNLSLLIDQEKGLQAIDVFTEHVREYAIKAARGLALESDDYASVFGLEAGEFKSVKTEAVKDKLIEVLGFETHTISNKKINPEKKRRNPEAGAVIDALGKANSNLSHKRRVNAFLRDTAVDLNLNYFGSHTGRWTSRSDGKGVNFLNLPKHDKLVAPLIRGMLSIEGDWVLVRGDAASLEYRMNCWLTNCQHGTDLFSNDVFADAYVAFGEVATGVRCAKQDPIRQVWKTTVLGLGFLMAPRTHALNLAKMLATEAANAVAKGTTPSITLDDFKDMCARNNWRMPTSPYYKRIRTETGLDEAIIAVAHHTHQLFHQVHPEFRLFAEWLGRAVEQLSRSKCVERTLDNLYRQHNAPDRSRVELVVDDWLQGRSIMVRCGPWYQPTLTWRDVGVRRDCFGNVGMCSVKAGNRGFRLLTPNALIENVVQAAGRNAISDGLLIIHRAFPQWRELNVHDEVLLAVPRTTVDVALAYHTLQQVYGPGGLLAPKWGWTCVMDPNEINASRSLWEEDVRKLDPQFWEKVERGDGSMLDLIP